MRDIREAILDLNPVLRGWGDYFRTGNASQRFQQTDRYVRPRSVSLLHRRGGTQRSDFDPREWPIVRFVGTTRYPPTGDLGKPSRKAAAPETYP